jgi:ATP-dependent Lhr-like helicase
VVLGPSRWPGRWALVHTPGLLGREASAEEDAAAVARQWLARYGIVSRDWWRRERPTLPWRIIYHELKRLEFRGDVRRGYFVAGLAGAQFALPEAVELLRNDERQPAVVFAASDPANVFSLPLGWGYERDPFVRTRGASALLVMVGGVVMVTAEGDGKRLAVRDGAATGDLDAAMRALIAHRARRSEGRTPHARDMVVEAINGAPALTSPLAPFLLELGFRRQPGGLALRPEA